MKRKLTKYIFKPYYIDGIGHLYQLVVSNDTNETKRVCILYSTDEIVCISEGALLPIDKGLTEENGIKCYCDTHKVSKGEPSKTHGELEAPQLVVNDKISIFFVSERAIDPFTTIFVNGERDFLDGLDSLRQPHVSIFKALLRGGKMIVSNPIFLWTVSIVIAVIFWIFSPQTAHEYIKHLVLFR